MIAWAKDNCDPLESLLHPVAAREPQRPATRPGLPPDFWRGFRYAALPNALPNALLWALPIGAVLRWRLG